MNNTHGDRQRASQTQGPARAHHGPLGARRTHENHSRRAAQCYTSTSAHPSQPLSLCSPLSLLRISLCPPLASSLPLCPPPSPSVPLCVPLCAPLSPSVPLSIPGSPRRPSVSICPPLPPSAPSPPPLPHLHPLPPRPGQLWYISINFRWKQ